MKKLLFAFALSLVFAVTTGQETRPIAIIPQPVKVEKLTDSFRFTESVSLVVPSKNAAVQTIATSFVSKLRSSTGFAINITDAEVASSSSIVLSLNNTTEPQLGNEGYSMEVGATGVQIKANQPAGLYYGIQTLLQLFPKEIESKEVVMNVSWILPACRITDYPRFAWRGLMYDVSRHFFTKDQMKVFIDDMAKYKFNLLHWHLTDDQGWRVEIKSLPKLTEVGAWRVDKTGSFNTFSKPEPNEPRTYGGFYTQDDIREIVKYAKERFIDILPEIDVPGHSMAAIAAYPDLTCTPGTYVVNSGEKFMEWPAGGHFYGLVDNALCPANEKVYDFLDKVFTEVAQLFPFGYIHMGGDETARNFWEKSEAIKGLMKRENLKNLDEVQSYFVKRVEKIIMAKGKKMIGWDEILDGGLAPNAAVMSWRGIKGGIEAAKLGHEVVMSPATFVYIDYMQGDLSTEPPVYASLRLKKTYEFEPVPDGVDAKFIKGGQGNLWTEQIYNVRQAQYMTWPRAFAIAESVWSKKERKEWDDFVGRVEQHFGRLDFAETKFSKAMYDAIVTPKKTSEGKLQINLATEIDGIDIY
ncbi:MAG: beta-N-acetylhexosaminidase, partial [Chitinophagaceae bacterium]|nr:beta-N-acetylhexosaminidase [Chitinophagaceae bacterium]